ncbi:MAG: hypothetical protein IJ134_00720 [Bacilli bacterium]|nr:hypothetical protein [Bacilli bacterium]
MGHIFAALYYKWNIVKIIILPFGGITIFNEIINKPIKEEFMIAIMGPIFQIVFYLILVLLDINSFEYMMINKIILFINLIPIIPLDGSKIIKLIGDYVLSFNLNLNINIIISFIFLNILFFYGIYISNLSIILMSIFLFKENIKTIKNKKTIFNKFLLERTMYNFEYKKIKLIKNKNVKKMKRDYYHLFFYNHTYLKESDFLKLKFDLSYYL